MYFGRYFSLKSSFIFYSGFHLSKIRFSSALAVLFHWVNVVFTLHGSLLAECLNLLEIWWLFFGTLWSIQTGYHCILKCTGEGALFLWGQEAVSKGRVASPDQELGGYFLTVLAPWDFRIRMLSIYSNCSFCLVSCLNCLMILPFSG